MARGVPRLSAALGDPLAPGATRIDPLHDRDPNPASCPGPAGDAFDVGDALRVVW